LHRCLTDLYTRVASTADAPATLCARFRAADLRRRRTTLPLFHWAALTVIGTHPAPDRPVLPGIG
jgi:hypothetical protein